MAVLTAACEEVCALPWCICCDDGPVDVDGMLTIGTALRG